MAKVDKEILPELHGRYIKDTPRGAVVQNIQAFLCHLTYSVKDGAGLDTLKVYVNTRVAKHVYDKRPAQEYDFLILHLGKIIRYPNKVYKNTDAKKGDYCFVKKFADSEYLCSLEFKNEPTKERMEVVTFFQIRKMNYLNNYKILWNWEDDASLHRSTFDSGLHRPNDTPQ